MFDLSEVKTGLYRYILIIDRSKIGHVYAVAREGVTQIVSVIS